MPRLGNSRTAWRSSNANDNSLIGCTIHDRPVRVLQRDQRQRRQRPARHNSNDTTIQANFFGMGADNHTAVGNDLNGVLVDGSSTNTMMGGPIPLGNVDAANGQNGIVVAGTASFFTSYNTFCGLAAFSTNPNLGNGHDGMLITSTGGNILIRTNVSPKTATTASRFPARPTASAWPATSSAWTPTATCAMGNKNNGVEVDGNAHDIIIGGPQPTFNIIPQNTISANGGNGVAIDGNATTSRSTTATSAPT